MGNERSRSRQTRSSSQSTPAPPKVNDRFVVDSLICSKTVQKSAGLIIPATTVNPLLTISPNGTITPLVTLNPHIGEVVIDNLLFPDRVISSGFLPADITITGVPLPVPINLPFQQEMVCTGACPEDQVTETPLEIEAVIVQGIAALGITPASILFKVILKTTVTVTRRVIATLPETKPAPDPHPARFQTPSTESSSGKGNPSDFEPPAINHNGSHKKTGR
ncbi:hypothetical protein [Salinithrix halophila]|uniref:SipL SPOCS domain-containing protein n=1 Tax=Salinithrix halophila TaxID=1485204 RepID=A0ABV8JGJ5_9BACL